MIESLGNGKMMRKTLRELCHAWLSHIKGTTVALDAEASCK